MKKKLLILIVILILFLAAAAFALYRHFYPAGADTDARPYSGTVEVIEVLPSFQVSGQIEATFFEEGQTVEADQILAVIDSAELSRQAARARANLGFARSRLDPLKTQARYFEQSVKARIAGAAAGLEKVTSGPRSQEVESAKQAVLQAKAGARLAREKADRAETLYREEVLPLARRDEALRNAEAAEAALRRAEEALKLAEEGARSEDIRIAQASLDAALAEQETVKRARMEVTSAQHQVELAEAEADLAATRLDHATVRSPIDGVVLSKNIEVGEGVFPGSPIASIADLSTVQVRFYIEEVHLGSLSLGSSVSLRSDSFHGKTFTGTLTFLSDRAEFTPKTIQTREERTRLVFMAKASVKNPDRRLKPGMPVDIFVESGN